MWTLRRVLSGGCRKMGQKLCTKDGTITYPKHELPDNTKWGPEKWDMDYRDNNRINCYDTGTAPCKTACPAHIAVQGYLKMAAQGRYTDALALIKRKIRSRQSAAVSATTAVRMHVQEELWTRQLRSMMSRNLSQNWI